MFAAQCAPQRGWCVEEEQEMGLKQEPEKCVERNRNCVIQRPNREKERPVARDTGGTQDCYWLRESRATEDNPEPDKPELPTTPQKVLSEKGACRLGAEAIQVARATQVTGKSPNRANKSDERETEKPEPGRATNDQSANDPAPRKARATGDKPKPPKPKREKTGADPGRQGEPDDRRRRWPAKPQQQTDPSNGGTSEPGDQQKPEPGKPERQATRKKARTGPGDQRHRKTGPKPRRPRKNPTGNDQRQGEEPGPAKPERGATKRKSRGGPGDQRPRNLPKDRTGKAGAAKNQATSPGLTGATQATRTGSGRGKL